MVFSEEVILARAEKEGFGKGVRWVRHFEQRRWRELGAERSGGSAA